MMYILQLQRITNLRSPLHYSWSGITLHQLSIRRLYCTSLLIVSRLIFTNCHLTYHTCFWRLWLTTSPLWIMSKFTMDRWIDRWIDWLIDWFIDWFVDLLIDRSIDWFIVLFINLSPNRLTIVMLQWLVTDCCWCVSAGGDKAGAVPVTCHRLFCLGVDGVCMCECRRRQSRRSSCHLPSSISSRCWWCLVTVTSWSHHQHHQLVQLQTRRPAQDEAVSVMNSLFMSGNSSMRITQKLKKLIGLSLTECVLC